MFRNAPERRSLLRILSMAVLLAVLLAGSAHAYIVVLKDGSQIPTKEKYRIEGDKAILILPSGVQASYDAADIDIERTEKINVVDYGTARLIEGQNTTRLNTEVKLDDKRTLSDLIGGREGGLALPEPRRRSRAGQPQAVEDDGTTIPLTQAGFVDLMALPKVPYPKTDITAEVMGYLKGQGVENVRVYKGSQGDHALLEIVTASEASVFKAIKDSANGLVQINERFPEVAAFELLLLTDSQVRAGQFVLTPELANILVTDSLDLPTFYLRYVEF